MSTHRYSDRQPDDLLPNGIDPNDLPREERWRIHDVVSESLRDEETAGTSKVDRPLMEMLDERRFRFGDTVVVLSPHRAQLIACLLDHGGQADHATIGEAVWGDPLVDRKLINKLVAATNKFLESYPGAPLLTGDVEGRVKIEI